MAYNPNANIVISGKTFMDVPSVQFKTPDGATVNFAHVDGSIRFSPTLEEQINNVENFSNAIIDPITSTLLNQLDSDFVAENIKKGVDLFGLLGTLEAGGGGGFQVALGTFTPAETTSLNSIPPISIEHNAGFTPDVFIFYNATASTYGILAISAKKDILWGTGGSSYTCYAMYHGNSSMGEGELKQFPLTGEVAYIRSNITKHKVAAGQEYRWIAIGGIL